MAFWSGIVRTVDAWMEIGYDAGIRSFSFIIGPFGGLIFFTDNFQKD